MPKNAVAASSVASGLGIACDVWFLLRYNWCGLQTFIVSQNALSFTCELTCTPQTVSRKRRIQILLLLLPLSTRTHHLHVHLRHRTHVLPRARSVRGMAHGRDGDVFCDRGSVEFAVFGV